MAAQETVSKQFLNQILAQNQMTNGFALNGVNAGTIGLKLNDSTNSVGFIYRHIGETMHLFTTFLGEDTTVQNTTLMQKDSGQGQDFEASKLLVTKGFKKLQEIIDKHAETWWLGEIDTPFFGKISRLKLFSHVLYHNSHHSGQISMTLSKGQ